MTDILINLLGIALIAAIVWWFWLSRPRARRAGTGEQGAIIVDGGVYTPSEIDVPAHRESVLRFLRRDPSPCAEQLIFDNLQLSVELPMGEIVEVRVPASPAGVYDFHCQMGMYRGRLVVKDAGQLAS